MPDPHSLANFRAMDAAAHAVPADTPDSAVASCAENTQRALRLVLRDAAFGLLTDMDYELQVAGKRMPGNSGKTGVMKQLVPADSSSARLRVWAAGSRDIAPLEWKLTLDDLDPIAVDTGAMVRLHNMEVDWTPKALHAFQEALQVAPSGIMDGPTRKALTEVYSDRELPAPPACVWRAPPARPLDPEQAAELASPPAGFFHPEGGRK